MTLDPLVPNGSIQEYSHVRNGHSPKDIRKTEKTSKDVQNVSKAMNNQEKQPTKLTEINFTIEKETLEQRERYIQIFMENNKMSREAAIAFVDAFY